MVPAGALSAQAMPIRAGGHVSVNPARFEVREERIGMHLIVPVLSYLEASPAIGYYLGGDFTGRAWQLAGTVRVRPFAPGTDSPLYLGVGGSVLHTERDSRLYDLQVVGVEFGTGRLSFFSEMMHYGLISRDHALNVALGFSIPL
jgi:hypothetical protein